MLEDHALDELLDDALLVASHAYDAFGEETGSAGSFANAYTFTGRERDTSGLYYYRARYYLAAAGRFLTPDPIGLDGGANPYTYVNANPVNFRDPFGLTPIGAKSSYSNLTTPTGFSAFTPGPSSTGSRSFAGSRTP